MAVFESQFSSLWILHPKNLTIVLLKVPKTAINNAVCYMKPNHLELSSLHCQITFSTRTMFSLPVNVVLWVCFCVAQNGYRCFAVLVRNGVSTLDILVSNRVWFLQFSLELVCDFCWRSHFFVIVDKTSNKSNYEIIPSEQAVWSRELILRHACNGVLI